ncbi:hypothetical protein HMPREF0970_00941 [Schaalia odontolytica F0309]|uniref:Uncharacterized protein n=1 Tax=Schaalia odontolytica F0309 TaxID=649742 RepID=D4TYB6_9ACTO|nr:hypothetical protein HMPREF0970_00941 [Schaalia odontolytica F0309]
MAIWIGWSDLNRKVTYPELPFLSRTTRCSRLKRTSPDTGG